MTGTNHALTGGVIGLAAGGPIAIPIAFASHFVCDWLPHFGMETDDRLLRRRFFIRSVAVDIFVFATLLILSINLDLSWYVYLAAIAAFIPDFSWIYRYVVQEKIGRLEPRPKNKFDQWHSDIQTKESVTTGAVFEAFWFVAMLIIFINPT